MLPASSRGGVPLAATANTHEPRRRVAARDGPVPHPCTERIPGPGRTPGSRAPHPRGVERARLVLPRTPPAPPRCGAGRPRRIGSAKRLVVVGEANAPALDAARIPRVDRLPGQVLGGRLLLRCHDRTPGVEVGHSVRRSELRAGFTPVSRVPQVVVLQGVVTARGETRPRNGTLRSLMGRPRGVVSLRIARDVRSGVPHRPPHIGGASRFRAPWT